MSVNNPESYAEIHDDRINTVLTILEQTARRMAWFESEQATLGIGTHLNDGVSTDSFRAIMQATLVEISEVLHGIGGMPLSYIDSVSGVTTNAHAFIVGGYTAESDQWKVIATTNQQPPTHGAPCIQLTCTTTELREHYIAATLADTNPYGSRELHPREP